MLKVQVPLNIHSDLPELLNLGGDEFYMGYLPPEALSLEQVISRRPGKAANPVDQVWITRQIALLKSAGKQLFAAFNEHFYSPDGQQAVMAAVDWLVGQGIDGLILADPGLLYLLRRTYPDLYYLGSTGLAVTNSEAARFFHARGFNRIILPRQLSIREIRRIVSANPGIDFEIFIKNDACPNLDGLCCYVHGSAGGRSFGQACCRIELPGQQQPAFLEQACGACALFDLHDLGLAACKIVGRDKSRQRIRNDLVFIKRVIRLLSCCHGRVEFQEEVKAIYRQTYGQICPGRCYYL